MPGRYRSKTDKQQNYMLEMDTLDALADSPVALTIEEICAKKLTLTGQSTQKMARLLSSLVNMGLVRKTKDKQRGKMIYMAVSQLEAQGYRLDLE